MPPVDVPDPDDTVLTILRHTLAARRVVDALRAAIAGSADPDAVLRKMVGLGAPGSDTELPMVKGRNSIAPEVTDTATADAYLAELWKRLGDDNTLLEEWRGR